VLQVADQQVLDPVFRVSGAAPPPVPAAHHPPPHVPDRLDRQVDDVEQVHRELRAGEHATHRGGVDAAHVDGHDPDRVPPRLGGLRQPVRGVVSGTAFHLPQQSLLAGHVKEVGVPPVREQHVPPRWLH
jgi:hypothetical protein